MEEETRRRGRERKMKFRCRKEGRKEGGKEGGGGGGGEEEEQVFCLQTRAR